MSFAKLTLLLTLAVSSLFSFPLLATPSGGDSERQSLLTVDVDSYTVLSVERLGHFTHYQFTNRIALKRYSLDDNTLLATDVLMETQLNFSAKNPPEPPTAKGTDTPLTTLQSVLGKRTSGFEGYIRPLKYKLKVSSEGIFMDKNNKRTVLISAEQLRKRVPDYLELAEYDAFEVVGIQGYGHTHYFVVVRSNEWGSDIGSFEQVIVVPRQ